MIELTAAQKRARKAAALKKQQDMLNKQKLADSKRNLNAPLANTPNIG